MSYGLSFFFKKRYFKDKKETQRLRKTLINVDTLKNSGKKTLHIQSREINYTLREDNFNIYYLK